ncbi:hypothetical protein BKA65DRAFT_472707 [Rhexocercosporidium sp. MPI-PUGE-AT-0058]|nr:hypothetical protein BKA65DRAFT_472707 [Rhexocercosporidium sp. MPI-PUGE-AT-0058]
MPHTQSALHLPSPTNTTSPSYQQRHNELPLPHPLYHSITLLQRATFKTWLRQHDTDIGGLLFVFLFLLILGGLWRSKDVLVQWWLDRRREEARKLWAVRETRRRKSVVVVGILRRGRGSGGAAWMGGGGEGKKRGLKRVRFWDGVGGVDEETVVVINANGERADVDVVVDFLEDGSVVGEVF